MLRFKIEYVFIGSLLLFILLNEQCQTDYKRNTQNKEDIHVKHKLDSLEQLIKNCNSISPKETQAYY